jgi:alkyldihydroxyacetonephosphate synthase
VKSLVNNDKISHEEAVSSTYWGKKRVELPSEYLKFIQETFKIESLDRAIESILIQEKALFPLSIDKPNLSEKIQLQFQKIPDCSFTTQPLERFIFSTGMSYYDLLLKRNGRLGKILDGIVRPRTILALQEAIKVANEHSIFVIPTGGKSSVTESIKPAHTTIALDLLALNKIISFQPENNLIEVEAGILLPDLESWLEKRNFLLGHSPQSFISTTIGGSIASRGAGHFSSYFGPMRSMVHSLTVETPIGTFIDRKNIVPESAAGPTLSELFIGSEGALGVISTVFLKIKPLQRKRFKSFLFKTFTDGMKAIQEAYQVGHHPATIRLSDSFETELLFATLDKEKLKNRLASIYLNYRGFDTNHRCILMVYSDGNRPVTKAQLKQITGICKKHHAISLGKGPAKKWHKTRYDLPYLRENFLELGVLIDTIETSTTFDKLQVVHDETIKILQNYCVYAMAHISHVYEDGASLYFTFIGKEDFNWDDPLIKKIRKEVIECFITQGATLSHHHGVGTVFKEFLPRERSEVANGILQSVKDYLDPNHIMNPSAGLLYKIDNET